MPEWADATISARSGCGYGSELTYSGRPIARGCSPAVPDALGGSDPSGDETADDVAAGFDGAAGMVQGGVAHIRVQAPRM